MTTTANISSSDVTTALGFTPVSNAGGAPSMQEGTFASMPAAGTAGKLYVTTDTKKLYRDNGTSWDVISPATAGTVTSVTAGALPIVVGGTSADPTISVNAATTTTSGVVTLAADNTTLASTVVQANDSRLSNARAPSGSAGGDLGSTYPNPTVNGLKGAAITYTSLTTGDFLKYNGTAWVNTALSTANLSDSSDLLKVSHMPANCAAGSSLTFSSPSGAWVCTALPVGSTSVAGVVQLATSGSATAGRVVEATDSRLTDARAPAGNAGGDLGSTYPNPTVTGLKGAAITYTSLTAGDYLKYNGTNWVNAALPAGGVSNTPMIVPTNVPDVIRCSDSYVFTKDYYNVNGTSNNRVRYANIGDYLYYDENTGARGSGTPTALGACPTNLSGVTTSWNFSGGGANQWTTAGANMYFNTGNVGVGTTTPGSLLTVNGLIESKAGGIKFPDGSIQTTAGGTVSGAQYDSGWQTVAANSVYSYTHGLGVAPLIVKVIAKENATGKMVDISSQVAYGYATYGGMGSVTYDATNIKISTTDKFGSYIDSGGAGQYLNYAAGSIRILAWTNGGPSPSYWSQSSTSVYYNGGNVGIGTTTPAAKLDVAGEIKLGNTSSTCNATNEGQLRYNSTGKIMEFCNGSVWGNVGGASSGAVYQVKHGSTNTPVPSSGATWISTGATVSITPSSASNKILVSAGTSVGSSGTGCYRQGAIALRRGATDLAGTTETFVTYESTGGNVHNVPMAVEYLDSPATTSATTYTLMFKKDAGWGILCGGDAYAQYLGERGWITVTEVAP